MIKVNGKEYRWWQGMTLSCLIDFLKPKHNYIWARVNDQVIIYKDFENFEITDGAEIFLMQVIAGG